MEARIRLDVGSADELQTLAAWLQAEDALRGRVRSGGSVPPLDQMGPVTDVLTVALGSGGAAAVLAVWLQQRHSDVSVEIQNTAHGRSVIVSAHRVTEVERLINGVLNSESGTQERATS